MQHGVCTSTSLGKRFVRLTRTLNIHKQTENASPKDRETNGIAFMFFSRCKSARCFPYFSMPHFAFCMIQGHKTPRATKPRFVAIYTKFKPRLELVHHEWSVSLSQGILMLPSQLIANDWCTEMLL